FSGLGSQNPGLLVLAK
nr:RecName: Full=Germin-like protein 3 [Betula pendula]